MRDDRFVYLSGPITARDGCTVEENVASAVKVYLALVAAGVPTFCPQLSAIFPSAWTQATYEQWMTQDLAVIARCSHLLLLPRWETSPGAMREKAYAEAIGVTVVGSIEALVGDTAKERECERLS